MTKRRYNYRRDIFDHRDFKFAMKMSLAIPPSMDLRPDMPSIVDQGQEGSCTANALSGCLGYLELQGDSTLGFTNSPFEPLSRQFIYYNERKIEGDIDSDSGAQLRDGCQVLNQLGACIESVWPYLADNLFTEPSTGAYIEAAGHKISQYSRVESLAELKASLAAKTPVALGFTVYESFETIGADGVMPMPADSESVMGGHAVVACGYDDVNKWVICRNSWGTSWGYSGYFYMPYAYFDFGGVMDMWAIQK
jgi:C1A family cysteine protease